jgi:hypothetical protein
MTQYHAGRHFLQVPYWTATSPVGFGAERRTLLRLLQSSNSGRRGAAPSITQGLGGHVDCPASLRASPLGQQTAAYSRHARFRSPTGWCVYQL